MRIAVIGAGIVGVTTAFELASDGHTVTVYERRQAVASEASFANSGVVAPGYVGPWAAPGMVWRVLASQFSADRPVRFGWGAVGMPGWIARYLVACRRAPHLANRRRMQRLAMYSRQRLDALSQIHDLQYDQRRGYLVMLRDARALARARRGLPILEELGVAHEVIDAAAVRQCEPALAEDAPVHAAIALPQDLVGNCRQFSHALKGLAQARGAVFRFGVEVQQLSRSQPGLLRWQETDNPAAPVREEQADAIVLCTGRLDERLSRRLGLRLPIEPVYGYSLTAPVRHREGMPDPGPRSGMMDDRYKVSITRLGQRIRVAGIAELGGNGDHLGDAPLTTLYRVLEDWFPGAADLAKVQHWKGARPMLPDGPPLIGPAGPERLWLNLGHGGSGWALSCGSARVLADLIAGRPPEIDIEGLGLTRWRRH